MSSNIDTMCQNCGNQQNDISSEQLEIVHTMCQACKDIALFKQPSQTEDCPICFLTIPSLHTGSKYQTCCGKVICSGCIHAVYMMKGEAKCPFCRVPTAETNEGSVRKIQKRVEMGDANAIHSFGCFYFNEERGFPQDRTKAFELWHRAGELGCASANNIIGSSYYRGEDVERNIEKAKHYWELGAIGGHAMARHNLGILEGRLGNMNMALRHYMISAGRGYDNSLKKIKEFYTNGHAIKDDYAKALHAYQNYVGEIKSAQRDEAAAFNSEQYRYY